MPAGMGRGGECTLVGRSVMSAGFALPRDAGRRPALRFARHPGWDVVGNARWQGAMSSGQVSRSRAMPVGDRRSVSRAIRDGMWWGIHVGRAQRHERWFRAPARCRRRPALLVSRASRDGSAGGGECTLVGHVMSAGFALPRDAGRRPALVSRASRPDVVGNSRW